MEQEPSVAHWSFHWQEQSQVPSEIYLSVLWCWHNVFLMSEIRLCMDGKSPLSFLPHLLFFLSWCQSVKQTRRQAEISLKPISYLFKEAWILEWEARPRWNRHLRVFIKLPISLLTFVTTTDHKRGSRPSFHFHCRTMKMDFQNNLHELSVWAYYVTWQSCMYLWLVLNIRRRTFML